MLRDRGDRAGSGESAVDPARERDEHHGVVELGPAFHLEHGTTVGEVTRRIVRSADPCKFGSMEFGVHTGLQNTTIAELTSLWRRIEDHGFEWISIWDHFYAADGTGNPHCLEAVASHAALAASTKKVRCGSLVYSVGYRHPAVLANAMATLDQLSNGRITLGLGGGWLAEEYNAYGIPFPPHGCAAQAGGRSDPVRARLAHAGAHHLRR